jgi:chemotaxis protein MotB
MPGRPQRDEGRGTTRWLTTFNDLVTLLMVFFVLIFTMATTDVAKLKQFQVSVMKGLGVLEEGEGASLGLIESFGDKGDRTGAISGEDIFEGDEPVADYLDALESFEGAEIRLRGRDRIMSLQGSALFDSGSADISPEAFPVLRELSRIVRAHSGRVRVEGHTDNIPIFTQKYASNWELSTARAVSIVKFLIEEGGIPPGRLSAVGYGELRPLAANDTPEGCARNRRVEIVLAIGEER